jgi:hypothetical protein
MRLPCCDCSQPLVAPGGTQRLCLLLGDIRRMCSVRAVPVLVPSGPWISRQPAKRLQKWLAYSLTDARKFDILQSIFGNSLLGKEAEGSP